MYVTPPAPCRAPWRCQSSFLPRTAATLEANTCISNASKRSTYISAGDYPIQLDGEQIRAKSMRIEVVPGALNVLQPLDIGHAEPIATAEAPKRPESSLSGRQ